MLRNYVVTALRNFLQHKLYSFINIFGLTVGLICAILIILFVRYELSYDKWLPGTNDLYRVEADHYDPGQPPLLWSSSPFPALGAMLAQLPEVKAAVHLEPWQMTVVMGDRQFLDQVNVVSPNFFQIIQLPLVAGDRVSLFRQPESVVISESAAKKYFGRKPAIGQILKVGGRCEWGPEISGCITREAAVVVTGVMRDLPPNTQLSGDVFIPNTSAADPMSPGEKAYWPDSSGFGYVKLQPGADAKLVTAKLPALLDRNFDPRKIEGVSLPASRILRFRLNPFLDDHLSTDRYHSLTPAGSWTTVDGFIAIGVLILLIACFNFTNLATARSIVRAREISLRKVMGANRRQLMAQFLGESILIALMALIIALALTEMLLPLYGRLLGRPFHLMYSSDSPILLSLVGIAILVGLIGGIYPAVVLSRIRPALVLRTRSTAQSGSAFLRTTLVVMQFAVSIGLGIAAVVSFEQISYARTIDLGLNKDGIVVINAGGLPPTKLQSLVHVLDSDPALKGAALSGNVPFSGITNNTTIEVPPIPGTRRIRTVGVGPGFFALYGIHLLSGRALSDSHGGDAWRDDSLTANVLINNAAAKSFGYSPQSAVGKTLFNTALNGKVKRMRLTIVGVTADFMFEGDRRKVVPAYYAYYSDNGLISAKVSSDGVPEALAAIDRTWHALAPSIAVDRHFLDADFERQFLADEQEGQMFGVFVVIAISIACLGLFGLAALSTERRTKEIGMRKAFGARTTDIILLLLWQFSIPVLVANLIAWPAAYFYLHRWLEGYAYRVALNPLYFVGVGAAAMIVAWVTVIGHAVRVARANPIKALRYE